MPNRASAGRYACAVSQLVSPPPPPPELAEYVGDRNRPDPVGSYLAAGSALRAAILDLLPDDWSFEGRRVLDFGCGSGRVLRHFLPQAEAAELHGCDIHGPSIEWIQANLSPSIEAVQSREKPPLPFPNGNFDLIWTMSVFTHLTDTWSSWLLELHRILAPDGILIASIMGPGMSETIANEPWDERRVGMNVLGYGQAWEAGGPMVLHSHWWIEAHWGRAFEILQLKETGLIDTGQGVVVMRKKDVSLTPADLEALEPGEPREVLALQHSVRQLHRERAIVNAAHDRYANAYHDERERLAECERQRSGLEQQIGLRPALRRAARQQARRARSLGARVRGRLLR
jgi:SAM-dependent methyltransferase